MAGRVTDETVFDAALAVIAEQGYERATTRAIADAAGINEATLFRRFTSKQNLLRQAVRGNFAGFALDLDAPGDDVAADLTKIVSYYSRLYETRGGVVLTLMREAKFSPEVASVLTEPEKLLERVDAVILHHQRRGALVVEPPRHTFFALVGPVMMRAIARRVDQRATQAPADPETVVRRFLAGHRPG
ncbi:TetR/AcrR family transcriptional regulator [Lentzea sp. NEAU-D7]|uniref:TetR/AcrR family transcriptional regulator n=1 Tax=Lentzea sp. NEAU-D7 TaxID=2994667 RepID=UPI00224B2BCA|nr:TetR/AcrR family transcriptional regulator [Lentzea sp. NEAU-D7]MCX2947005.1 helix-turn-helix domain containing protein [Lentzea sp. NEAU-D7]